jgi:glycosyltransferase involved in cell wall biosynthesis
MTISLLFLTYNRLGITARCLSSLAPTLRREDVEWIILDNGSRDGTADWLRALAGQWDGKVRIELYARNLGVAGGRARLLEIARGDTFIILDSDVEAKDDGWLDRLLAPLARPDVWLCGPGGAWVTPDWRDFVGAKPDWQGEIDVVSGYCQAFDRRVIDAGIVLDQYYNPRWHEDSSYCLSIRAAGGAIWHTGDIGLRHIFSYSGDDGSSETKLAYFRRQFQGRGLIHAERQAVRA